MEAKKSQTQKLFELLSDGRAHCTVEIMEKVYGNDHLGLARVGARIWDIKNEKGVEIDSWRDVYSKSLWWYQLRNNAVPAINIIQPKQTKKAKSMFVWKPGKQTNLFDYVRDNTNSQRGY